MTRMKISIPYHIQFGIKMFVSLHLRMKFSDYFQSGVPTCPFVLLEIEANHPRFDSSIVGSLTNISKF